MFRLIFYSIILLFFNRSYALDIDINVSGEIYSPPCVINDNDSVNIDFGVINSSKIDFINYKKNFAIDIYCEHVNRQPSVVILGNVVNGSSHTLQSTNKNLGISVYLGRNITQDNIVKIGRRQDDELVRRSMSGYQQNRSELNFTALPVKVNSSPLETGPFSATMSILFFYD